MLTTPDAGEDVEEQELVSLLMGVQRGQPLWEIAWGFLPRLNMLLPCDPAAPLLGIYPEELKT